VTRRREIGRRRASADELLAGVSGTRVPPRLEWRAAELTAPKNRQALAKQLRRLAEMAGERFLFTPVPVSLSTLRPNRSSGTGMPGRNTVPERTRVRTGLRSR
jgi:hypothetical protein